MDFAEAARKRSASTDGRIFPASQTCCGAVSAAPNRKARFAPDGKKQPWGRGRPPADHPGAGGTPAVPGKAAVFQELKGSSQAQRLGVAAPSRAWRRHGEDLT